MASYRRYLDRHPEEWAVLDGLCRVTISRFWRDRAVFERLVDDVLPAAARDARRAGEPMRCWSAGCASGEEAWSLKLLWDRGSGARSGLSALEVLGTDVDPVLLGRARRACYPAGALKEVPTVIREADFTRKDGDWCIGASHREGVTFRLQDIRRAMPRGTFDVILCRNLAFTYFDDAWQRRVLERLTIRLARRGALVVGTHEALPVGASRLIPMAACPQIYRHSAAVHDARIPDPGAARL